MHLARLADGLPIHAVNVIEGAGEDGACGLQRLLGLFRQRVRRGDDILTRARQRRLIIEPGSAGKKSGWNEDRSRKEKPRRQPGVFTQTRHAKMPRTVPLISSR